MRIIIYGAGAIGGVVGGHLARTGQDVTMIGRHGHVKAIQEHGLRFITPTGTHILRVQAVTTPDEINFEPDDVVFLTMKGQNTEEAVRALRRVTEDVPIFCLQNGVRNEETVNRYFPRVYGVMVRIDAVYLTDGEVMARRDPPGWLIMGRYPVGTDKLVEAVATRLRNAGFLVLVTSDVMPHKWSKLMANLTNAIEAITNASREDVNLIARAAQQELQEMLPQMDIRQVTEQELAKDWPESTIQPRSTLHVEAHSSTWQSLARRQGTVETDFLNGEVVRLAKKLGRQAPINETLLRICQEMATNCEPPGKYTPAQLCSLLGMDNPSSSSRSSEAQLQG